MKKRIAVFAVGRGAEILEQFIKGVQATCSSALVDIYLFLNFPLLMDSKEYIKGELNIYNLPDLTTFDGAIVFGNSMDFENVFEHLNQRCALAGIPTVTTGREPKYGHYLAPDNYMGAKLLCEHLKENHNVKNVFYMAGSENNPDSVARHQVVKEVFTESKEEDVFYTNWDISATAKAVDEICSKNSPLPDAIICANDGLAIYTIDELAKHGISVPEEILVTGFDDTYVTSVFTPTITTVSQNFYALGQEAADTVLRLIKGNMIPLKQTIPCALKARNSCNCPDNGEADAARAKLCHDLYLSELENNNFAVMLNRLDAAVMSAREFNDLYGVLCEFYTYFGDVEKKNFHLIIEPNYENSVYYDDVNLPACGYSQIMNNIFSMNNGQMSNNPDFKVENLIPHLEMYEDNAHTFIFMPLHDGEESIGYFIMPDAEHLINNNNRLLFYQQRLMNIFKKFRESLLTNYLNNKLSILNETDSLTQVKNRQAYESRTTALNKKITEKMNLKFAFAMFDVNNLKKINDQMGHEAGDEYIINCCKFLCNVFKRSPVYRVGGDEFLVILMDEDYDRREELMDVFTMQMDMIKDKRVPLTEQISIASGMSDYNPLFDYNCASVFKRADEQMYENKQKMKAIQF